MNRIMQKLGILVTILFIFFAPIQTFAVTSLQITDNDKGASLIYMFSQKREQNVDIDYHEELIGFDGKDIYELYVFTNGGYAVYSNSSNSIIEISYEGESPYTSSKGEKYYGGPLNYAYKIDHDLFSLRDNNKVEKLQIGSIAADCFTFENETIENSIYSEQLAVIPTQYAVSVSYVYYIKYQMPIGNNVNGTCGSVAAGMMLTCADRYVNNNIVPSEIPYGEPLHLSLIQYCELPSGGSTSASVKNGINNWTSFMQIHFGLPSICTARYAYVIHDSYIVSQIDNNKTCVVALGQILGSPYGNHMVMAYGYDWIDRVKYYRAHLGYSSSGSSDTWINGNWSIGATWLKY